MIGFIKGLFKEKQPLPGEEGQEKKATPKAKKVRKPKQNSEAYFLSNDDAKTLGDIDYMRTPFTVKRTFPQTLGSDKGAELVQEISALEKKVINGSNVPQPKTAFKKETTISKDNSSAKRRSTDTSMDMFRDMARNLKK